MFKPFPLTRFYNHELFLSKNPFPSILLDYRILTWGRKTWVSVLGIAEELGEKEELMEDIILEINDRTENIRVQREARSFKKIV